jgi:16S rRNA (uracil1498-N3)-methyltransferase
MQLFFCHTHNGDTAGLNEEETRHLKVLRKQVGDTIACIDGKGQLLNCRICKIGKDQSELEVIDVQLMPSERNYYLHLLIAPTKNNERIEWMLEKAVETGIDAITFIETEHSEKHRINFTRLERIAISALKQSGRFYLPEIHSLQTLETVTLEKGFFFAHCADGEKVTLKSFFKTASPDGRYQVLIGPEGDFSSKEIQTFYAQGGRALSLGSGRLRTETAGLYIAMTFSALS